MRLGLVAYVMVRAVVSRQRCDMIFGACGVPVAESAVVPPGPIPNPVVTHCSAGEYCGGNAVGGEAAAGTSQARESCQSTLARGGAEAARWAHNPKVGGSNPPPATHTQRPDAHQRPASSAFAPRLLFAFPRDFRDE